MGPIILRIGVTTPVAGAVGGGLAALAVGERVPREIAKGVVTTLVGASIAELLTLRDLGHLREDEMAKSHEKVIRTLEEALEFDLARSGAERLAVEMKVVAAVHAALTASLRTRWKTVYDRSEYWKALDALPQLPDLRADRAADMIKDAQGQLRSFTENIPTQFTRRPGAADLDWAPSPERTQTIAPPRGPEHALRSAYAESTLRIPPERSTPGPDAGRQPPTQPGGPQPPGP